jgi:hypothetical protein
VRISADPGFRWLCRRAGLEPDVLGRFAGAPTGKLAVEIRGGPPQGATPAYAGRATEMGSAQGLPRRSLPLGCTALATQARSHVVTDEEARNRSHR